MFVKNVLPPTGKHIHSCHVFGNTLCSVGITEYSRPNETVLCAAALMSEVYDDHKDEDGFLYITYSGENTFG